MSQTNKTVGADWRSSVVALAIGLTVAFLVAWGIPALAVAVTSDETFAARRERLFLAHLKTDITGRFADLNDYKDGFPISPPYKFNSVEYFLVFIRNHHDVARWLNSLVWPDAAFPLAVILSPLLGGVVFHLFWRRDVARSAIIFAVSYFGLSLFIVGLVWTAAGGGGFGWSRLKQIIEAQGMSQMLTLSVLAAAMSAFGAWVVERLTPSEKRNKSLSIKEFTRISGEEEERHE